MSNQPLDIEAIRTSMKESGALGVILHNIEPLCDEVESLRATVKRLSKAINKANSLFDEWSDDDSREAGESFDVLCQIHSIISESPVEPTKGDEQV